MNEETIKAIDERIKRIKEKFSMEFGYYDADNIEKVYLFEPEEDDLLNDGVEIDAFMKYTENIEELIKIDNTSVRCGKFRQTIVYEGDSFVKCYPSLIVDDCKLSIVYQPFFIGIIAFLEGYDSDHPYSFYTAVELEYIGENRMTEEEETILIKRYLYAVSTKLGYSVSIDTFNKWPDFSKEDESICGYKNQVLNIVDIPPYSEAMDYYIGALSTSDNAIRFLMYYKVVEYFYQRVSMKEYYEKCIEAKSFIEFELLNRKEIFKSGEENIPKTILRNCIETDKMTFLFSFLPEKTQNDLKKRNKLKKGDSIISKLNDIKNDVASILCSTRNSIVHAKSNYKPKGNECPEEDMEELNEFMDKLCQCVFAWNGKQPEIYRLK
jgi:hypothetical protein